jgi:hypothetical protein
LFLGTEFGLFFTVDGGEKWVELTGGVPTISFRDVVIQRRENDLVAGSFGRGIFILDDYSPLRSLTAEQLENDALLFPARTTPWYSQNSLHSDSQGDDQYVAKNPDFGATMTYYLKDSLTTAKQTRQKTDKALVKAGKGTLHPDWDTLESENRESKVALYLTIKDDEGNVVRRVKAMNKKGIHRVTWNLRYAEMSAITGAGPVRSYPPRDGGILAAPGSYTATLNSRVDGTVTKLAGPVSFEVEVMRSETALKGSTPEEVTAFARKTSKAMRAVSASSAALKELTKKLGLFRKALDRAEGTDAALEAEWYAIRTEVFELDEALTGLKSRERKGATPETIQSRLQHVMMGASSSYGPTNNHKEQFGYAMEALKDVRDRLNALTGTKVPAFQKALEEAGAPWTPGSDVPDAN